jgi:hypothetical protein
VADGQKDRVDSPMIVVRMMGGLGNQLFQYALGRALSIRNGGRLLLDLAAFRNDPQRDYVLDRLNVQAEIADARLVRRIKPMGIAKLRRIVMPSSVAIVRERSARFDPDVLDLTGDAYLDGYWQSERYFTAIADTIRADFRLRNDLAAGRRGTEQAIRGSQAVSVHVRRGDYVANPATNAFHGTVPPEWYQAAMARIAALVPDASFFVFSDDPEWAKANLASDRPIAFIGPQADGRDEEDMHLMSACRHHIIANSSFSWWAAWLNPSPDKHVIAPKRWFLDPSHDARDLVPDAWERL